MARAVVQLSPEQWLEQKNVSAFLEKIVVSLLETRPENIEQHVMNMLKAGSVPTKPVTKEAFPSYGGGSPVPITLQKHGAAMPTAEGRRQSAISPDVLRNRGVVRRQAISSRMTSSTDVKITFVPKDEETTAALEQSVKKVDLFSFLQEDQRKALVGAMFKREYNDTDTIIVEGDKPDNFYIIEKGKCKVRKIIGGENKEVATIEAGRYFGELALISGSTRAASVYADGPVVCWAIDQTTYLGLLKEHHNQKRQRYRQLLRSVSFLNALQDYELLLVTDALIPLFPEENSIIVKQGDSGDEFFIVLDGSCSVVKDGKEVGRLGNGSYFGELALLHNVPRAATITALKNCKLCKLDRKSFHRLLGPCSQIFQDNMKKYND